MAGHHTQGRQGQGARRHRNNKGRPYRRRMPRAQETPAPKPGLLQRILNFFGFDRLNSLHGSFLQYIIILILYFNIKHEGCQE